MREFNARVLLGPCADAVLEPGKSARPSLARGRIRGHTRPVATKTYSREEADEILRRALAQQAGTRADGAAEGISHEDLLAAAKEVGISSSAIEAAAEELGESRIVEQRAELIRRRKRRAFFRHLVLFLVVNAGMFLFDWFDGGPWFFQYPLIVWSVILASIGMAQLTPEHDALVRRAEREIEKEQRRAARRRPKGTRGPFAPSPGAGATPAQAAREFERAVQEGVSTLLSNAARAIRGVTPADPSRYRVQDPIGTDGGSSSRDQSEKSASRRQRS